MRPIGKLHEAKSRLSEVVDDALLPGPQIITRRGVETAVLLSYAEYRRLLLKRKPLSEFFAVRRLPRLHWNSRETRVWTGIRRRYEDIAGYQCRIRTGFETTQFRTAPLD